MKPSTGISCDPTASRRCVTQLRGHRAWPGYIPRGFSFFSFGAPGKRGAHTVEPNSSFHLLISYKPLSGKPTWNSENAFLDLKTDSMAAMVHRTEPSFDIHGGPLKLPKSISSFELTLKGRLRHQ